MSRPSEETATASMTPSVVRTNSEMSQPKLWTAVVTMTLLVCFWPRHGRHLLGSR